MVAVLSLFREPLVLEDGREGEPALEADPNELGGWEFSSDTGEYVIE